MEIFLIASFRKSTRFDPSRARIGVYHRRVFIAPMKNLNPASKLLFTLDPILRTNTRPLDYSVSWVEHLSEDNSIRFGHRIRLTWTGGQDPSLLADDRVPVRAEVALLNYFSGSLLEVIEVSAEAVHQFFRTNETGPLLTTLRQVGTVEMVASARQVTIVEGQKPAPHVFSRLEKLADPAACSAVMQRYFSVSGLIQIEGMLQTPGTVGQFLQQILTHLTELIVFCTHANAEFRLRPLVGPAKAEVARIAELVEKSFIEPLQLLKSNVRAGLDKSVKEVRACLMSLSELETDRSPVAIEAISKAVQKVSASSNFGQISTEEESMLQPRFSNLETQTQLTILDLSPFAKLAFGLCQAQQHHAGLLRKMSRSHTKHFSYAVSSGRLIFCRREESQQYTLELPEEINRESAIIVMKLLHGDLLSIQSTENMVSRFFVVDLLEQHDLMNSRDQTSSKSEDFQLISCPSRGKSRWNSALWERNTLLVVECSREEDIQITYLHQLSGLSDLRNTAGWVSKPILTPLATKTLSGKRVETAITRSSNGRQIFVGLQAGQMASYCLACLEYKKATHELLLTASLQEITEKFRILANPFTKNNDLAWLEVHNRMFAVAVERPGNFVAVHYHHKDTFILMSRICGQTVGRKGMIQANADSVIVLKHPSKPRWAVVCTKSDQRTKQTGRPTLRTWLLQPGY